MGLGCGACVQASLNSSSLQPGEPGWVDSQGGGGSCLCLCACTLLPSVCVTLSWFRLSHDHDREFVSSQNASEDTTNLGGWMSLSGPPDQGFGACKPLPAGADPKTACSASGVKPVQCPAVRTLMTPGLSRFLSRTVFDATFPCLTKRLLWLGVGCGCVRWV